ncbi:MAG TPA: ABC-three component system protein, partial [Candidatus Angelobacter sp.]
ALWQLLDGPEEQELALEALDDIVVESPAKGTGLLQTKYHVSPAALTNLSADLWKTIRIWSEHLKSGAILIPPATLTLITTGTAPEGSISSLLRPGLQRDISGIVAALLNASSQSENEKLQPSFVAFTALTDDQRSRLISAITILDKSPDITDVREKIEEKLKLSVDREHRNAVLERLEGWWFDEVTKQFLSKNGRPITGFEIADKVRSIADQFGPNALPIDFLHAQPDSVDARADDRTFVKQLREIDVGGTRIEKAILDYYRAYEQRSRWARDELLVSGEIDDYEAVLIDEWERYAAAVGENLDENTTEEVLRQTGKAIFNWMEQNADFRIRADVSAPYVMRGSYHILANACPNPRVWWHPKFLERLSAVLAGNPNTSS